MKFIFKKKGKEIGYMNNQNIKRTDLDGIGVRLSKIVFLLKKSGKNLNKLIKIL